MKPGAPMAERGKRFEVHEHRFVNGPRAGRIGNTWPLHLSSTLRHSHEGGNTPHLHPDTGPAAYTIDKDRWARATGMVGGGRKKFTAKPSGDQLPVIPQEPQAFDVFIVGKPPAPRELNGRMVQETGPGEALPLRIMMTFGMSARVHDLRGLPLPEKQKKEVGADG